MTKQYIIIIEHAVNNFSAFCLDIPGCVSTGKTVENTVTNMKGALQFHLEEETQMPVANSLNWHIENKSFDELAENYFITSIDVTAGNN